MSKYSHILKCAHTKLNAKYSISHPRQPHLKGIHSQLSYICVRTRCDITFFNNIFSLSLHLCVDGIWWRRWYMVSSTIAVWIVVHRVNYIHIIFSTYEYDSENMRTICKKKLPRRCWLQDDKSNAT